MAWNLHCQGPRWKPVPIAPRRPSLVWNSHGYKDPCGTIPIAPRRPSLVWNSHGYKDPCGTIPIAPRRPSLVWNSHGYKDPCGTIPIAPRRPSLAYKHPRSRTIHDEWKLISHSQVSPQENENTCNNTQRIAWNKSHWGSSSFSIYFLANSILSPLPGYRQLHALPSLPDPFSTKQKKTHKDKKPKGVTIWTRFY